MSLLDVEVAAVLSAVMVALILWVVNLGLDRVHVRRKEAKHRFREILKDKYGYYSLTRFQFFLWTVIFLFSLTWVYFTRFESGVLVLTAALPANTLILMGINTASAVGSTAIQSIAGGDKGFWGMLYSDDANRADLARVQFFIWTVVSIIIYLGSLFGIMLGQYLFGFSPVNPQNLSIPDVDASLVTLMGLSHTAYVGAKYVKSPSRGARRSPTAATRKIKSGLTSVEAKEAIEEVKEGAEDSVSE